MLRVLIFFIFLIGGMLPSTSCLYAEESITLTTYYPAPFGAYDQILLVPREKFYDDDCTEAREGTIYFEKLSHALYSCRNIDGDYRWGYLPTTWTQSHGNVFLTDNQHYFSVNVGIGTTQPVERLDVHGRIKIKDGTQGEGRVLTSDAEGFSRWQNPQPVITGPFVLEGFVKRGQEILPVEVTQELGGHDFCGLSGVQGVGGCLLNKEPAKSQKQNGKSNWVFKANASYCAAYCMDW